MLNHMANISFPSRMGKTIQIIALFVSDSAKPNLVVAYVHGSLDPYDVHVCHVFRPTVAIMQWRNEIASHTDGLKVLVWHGSARNSDVSELKKFDVVSIEIFVGFFEGC